MLSLGRMALEWRQKLRNYAHTIQINVGEKKFVAAQIEKIEIVENGAGSKFLSIEPE